MKKIFLLALGGVMLVLGCSKEKSDKEKGTQSYSEEVKIYDQSKQEYIKVTFSSEDRAQIDSMKTSLEDWELVVERDTDPQDIQQRLKRMIPEDEPSAEPATVDTVNKKGLPLTFAIDATELLKTKKEGESLGISFRLKVDKKHSKGYGVSFPGIYGSPINLPLSPSADIVIISNSTKYWNLWCLCTEYTSFWRIWGDQGSKHDFSLYRQSHIAIVGNTQFCLPGEKIDYIQGWAVKFDNRKGEAKATISVLWN